MTDRYISITETDLALVAIILIASGALSVVLQMGIGRSMALSTLRMVLQLAAVGFVLRWLFDAEHPVAVAVAVTIMLVAAAHTAATRPSRSFRGATMLSMLVMTVCGLGVSLFAVAAALEPTPWYSARFLIPILGMVLGNALTGTSLCIDSLLDILSAESAKVETELAHGATRWEAAREPMARAVRKGMVPILNAMSVVGVVSLPGMMTGQILAGAPAIEAAKYQILIFMLIGAATCLVCIGICFGACAMLFNREHQLCVERIQLR